MRNLLVGAALLICIPAQAQETTGPKLLNERLNESEDAQSFEPAPMPSDPDDQAQPAPIPSEPDDRPNVSIVPMDEPADGVMLGTTFADLPTWGVVVRDSSGEVVDVFGQVRYTVTDDGTVEVPGYEPPPGSSLELVPQTEFLAAMGSVSSTDLDSRFKPLADIPEAVEEATAFLAQELCTKRWRPTEITLSLVVHASGTVLIVSAGTQAGSSVSWDLQDVCSRYGLEGEGIAFE